MTVDPQAQALLDEAAALNLPTFEEVGYLKARAGYERRPPSALPVDVARVEDRVIDGPDDNPLPIRLYWPADHGQVEHGRADHGAPHPVLVFFHGGGWVLGSIETHDLLCRSLTQKAGCLTVSVGYRLAPEHPFPAPAEDCYAATAWAAFSAGELGADANRLAVAGDSAGGNLAAAVALMCRDRGGPILSHQALIYPVTDFDLDTGSMQRNADGYLLTRSAMGWFYDHYVPNADDRANPYAAPSRAANHADVAPATVLVAGYDPLHDEGVAYAAKLEAAGVPTTLLRYPGQFHGFFQMTKLLDQANQAQDEIAAALRAAWS